jgi:hypothetical protein
LAEEPHARWKRGDRVEWNYRGTVIEGTVQRRLTAPTEIGGRNVAASREDPRYVVKSRKTGRLAAHRGPVLRRRAS